MYIIYMFNTYNMNSVLKPVTLYMLARLYETYQIEAQKKGKKASELIRDAMEDYAQRNFYHKKSMTQLNLNRTVKSKTINDSSNQTDFLAAYKNDFMDDQTSSPVNNQQEK